MTILLAISVALALAALCYLVRDVALYFWRKRP